MDEILKRSLRFSEVYGKLTIGEVMIELEKYEQLQSDLRRVVKEWREQWGQEWLRSDSKTEIMLLAADQIEALYKDGA